MDRWGEGVRLRVVARQPLPGIPTVGFRRQATVTTTRPDHIRFFAAVRAGRTFVTNGPLLLFTLTGKATGDEIRVRAGGATLQARATLASIVPVDHVEIIGNGKVVADLPLSGDGRSLRASRSIPVTTSGWHVLRAFAKRPEHPFPDIRVPAAGRTGARADDRVSDERRPASGVLRTCSPRGRSAPGRRSPAPDRRRSCPRRPRPA